jgi:hypothetical protein
MNAQAIAAVPSPIYTSSAVWHEVPMEKIKAAYDLRGVLKDSVDPGSFGSGLKRIWFVFIIMKGGEHLHPNTMIFRRKTALLEIYWRMDYERVMAATLEEFKTYLAEFFVEVLAMAMEQKKIKDFDRAGFITALTQALKAAQK